MPTLGEHLTSELSAAVCEKVQRKTIRFLCSCRETLSGEDSGLANAWDEICVQVQGEQSFFWDTYLDTTRDFIRNHLEALPRHEQCAVWFATDSGRDWAADHLDEADPPFILEDMVEHILNEYVLREAQTWSNRRIRAFMEGSSELD